MKSVVGLLGLALLLASCGVQAASTALPAPGAKLAARSAKTAPIERKAGAPVLSGIAFQGRLGESFLGETSQPMVLDAVIDNPTGVRVSYRWTTDGEYLGQPDKSFYHFIGFRVGSFTVTCTLLDAAWQPLDSKQVTIALKRATLPPDLLLGL
jgi:hypothetical protein